MCLSRIHTFAHRNKASSQRVLGYIPDQSPHGKTKYDLKLEDYHIAMGIILNGLRSAQEACGISWTLQLDGVNHDVVLKPYIFDLPGDTEGQDKLCGRFGTRTSTTARLCRACDTPPLDSSDPFHDFTYTKMADIKALRHDGKLKELRNMSYHPTANAFS